MIDLIAGLVLLALGAWGLIAWWDDFGELLRGAIPLVFVLIGLAAVGAGLHKTRRQAELQGEDDDLAAPSEDSTFAVGRSD